jgi:type I restriction enzyme S subunit
MNWQRKKLGEICEENIKSPFKVENATNTGEYPFFTSGDNILTHEEYLVDGENIFLATGGYANVKYFNGKASYSADTWSLKVKNASTKYVFYQIFGKLKYIDEVLFRGSGLRHLQKKEFLNLEIPLPPLPVQQKIVKILDTIQSAVEVQEKIIEKTKELKKALMNLLFHYGLAGLRIKELAGLRVDELTSSEIKKLGLKLKKTEIGEIPEDWEVVKLGDKRLFEIKLGGTPKTSISDYWNGKIPWITPNDLSELTTPYIEDTQRKISTSGLKAGSTLLPENSIILSTRAPIGYVALLRRPMAFNQGCKGIVIKDKSVVSLFVYYFLLSKAKLLQELGTGSTFRELATGDLENFRLPLPPLPEQQEIAEILQTIDQKIEIEKKKKELYHELFKTLLNKIMNQEIDVNLLDYQGVDGLTG